MTKELLIAATLIDSVLAGVGLDRMIVQMPAWRRVGVRAWAIYSRRADLGNGRLLYSLVAIGGALLTIAASIAFHFDKTLLQTATIPMYAGVVFVIGGLLLTMKAAPKMLSLKRIDDDPGLRQAFEGFDRWGSVRAVMQMLAFVANLWALVAILD